MACRSSTEVCFTLNHLWSLYSNRPCGGNRLQVHTSFSEASHTRCSDISFNVRLNTSWTHSNITYSILPGKANETPTVLRVTRTGTIRPQWHMLPLVCGRMQGHRFLPYGLWGLSYNWVKDDSWCPGRNDWQNNTTRMTKRQFKPDWIPNAGLDCGHQPTSQKWQ